MSDSLPDSNDPGPYPPPPPPAPAGPNPASGMAPQPSPLTAGGDYTNQFSAAEINEGKTLSIIGYLGILFLVPLLALPNNRFARFHANQGLVLLLGWVAASIVVSIIGELPFIGLLSLLLWPVVGIGFLVIMVMAMVSASGGNAKTLPLIGNFQLLK